MTVKDYYLKQFASDVQAFIADSPVQYFGHGWHYHCASQLNRVHREHLGQFLVCLYFTVLVDQSMHAHYRDRYLEFERLTKYPKFCHGLSQVQHNPRGILLSPVEQRVVSSTDLTSLLAEGMALFVDEVTLFLGEYMPDIDPRAFFHELLCDPDVQIPELLIVVDPSLKDDVVSVAYRELRAAVQRALPAAG